MSLTQIAAMGKQCFQLFLALDALGQDAHLEHASKIEDGLQDRPLLAWNRQVGNQTAVDLHQINGQTDEVVHRGQAGAEVVKSKTYMQIGHGRKHRQGALRILIDNRLGHLEAQPPW